MLVVITVLDDSFQRDVDAGVLYCHCRDDSATIAATATSAVPKAWCYRGRHAWPGWLG